MSKHKSTPQNDVNSTVAEHTPEVVRGAVKKAQEVAGKLIEQVGNQIEEAGLKVGEAGERMMEAGRNLNPNAKH